MFKQKNIYGTLTFIGGIATIIGLIGGIFYLVGAFGNMEATSSYVPSYSTQLIGHLLQFLFFGGMVLVVVSFIIESVKKKRQ